MTAAAAAPLVLLAALVVIDHTTRRHRRRARPHRWALPACGCATPDPESRDIRYASRCRRCGDWWDVHTGAPLEDPP